MYLVEDAKLWQCKHLLAYVSAGRHFIVMWDQLKELNDQFHALQRIMDYQRLSQVRLRKRVANKGRAVVNKRFAIPVNPLQILIRCVWVDVSPAKVNGLDILAMSD
ncbi:hypothetical protein Nepgr_015233 [Nepenthes gracilis]|uniref:Uncharacterized protein n=1 Tax=Nepenthes gracilis TaxID=150966 RepID=A0AAD3XQ85_NEPGR|nr:hypothetical protein Nepgr_015233 [Nepenthes gracilis]